MQKRTWCSPVRPSIGGSTPQLRRGSLRAAGFRSACSPSWWRPVRIPPQPRLSCAPIRSRPHRAVMLPKCGAASFSARTERRTRLSSRSAMTSPFARAISSSVAPMRSRRRRRELMAGAGAGSWASGPGMEHEQTRCDRDACVVINWANVEPGRGQNLERHCTGREWHSRAPGGVHGSRSGTARVFQPRQSYRYGDHRPCAVHGRSPTRTAAPTSTRCRCPSPGSSQSC